MQNYKANFGINESHLLLTDGFFFTFISKECPMRFSKLILFVVLLMIGSKAVAQDLDTYQWKNRIILLKEQNLDSDWLKGQLKRLLSDIGELNERQLLVFIISDGVVYDIEKNKTDLNAQTIIKEYELTDFEGFALIGKDGGVKMKEDFIVNPKTVFELIDSMPMRLSETKNK